MRLATVVACVLAAVPSARAELPPSFALAYEAPDGAGCPTEDALRGAVADELGYDPWDPVDDGTSPRIVVAIRAAHGRVYGRVEMRATDGRHVGARELHAANCAELSRALALAIVVAIDPMHIDAPAPPAEAHKDPDAFVRAPLPSRGTVEEEPPPPPRPLRFVDELRLRVAFGIQGTVDAAPGPTFGFMGRVGGAWRRWSLAVELRGDLPGSGAADGGRVSASTMAAFLVPCVAHRIVGFCLLGGAGAQEVAGSGFVLARSSWVPYAALGGRIEIALAVSRALAVLVHVDVLAPVTRTELYIGSERPQRVYRSPPVASSLGLALSTR